MYQGDTLHLPFLGSATWRGPLLQAEIVLIVPGKIQGLGLVGDPFAGIIAEPETFICFGFHSLFCAENDTILQACPMGTVNAGALNFFSEQHMYLSFLS